MEIYGIGPLPDVKLVTAGVPYINLQWTRRYYDFGEWEMQLPAWAYDPAWAFVVADERPEVGIVQKVSYTEEAGEKLVTIGGFFGEKLLDRIVCSPRYIGTADKTERTIWNLCETYGVEQNINGLSWKEGSPLLGDKTESDFEGDSLGTKALSILETHGLSLRLERKHFMVFDYLELSVWQGVDHSWSQEESARVLLSAKLGDVTSTSASIDDSDYANFCRISANDGATHVDVDQRAEGEELRMTFLDKGSSKPGTDQSEEDWLEALRQEGRERLADKAKVVDIDFEVPGDLGYLERYDLGDVVTVEVEGLGLQLETRIVEVSEVFKGAGHSVTLGFGTKRISNIRRATLR